MTPTARLLDFAAAAHRLPADVRADAERLLADTLLVGAAGSTAPGADGVLTAARGWGAGGEARLIGTDERLPAPSAAFVNGFRIHCLEWDAVHEPAVVHAMSVVTAALSAAIDGRGGCDPDEALAALAVGVDVACGLGIAATTPLSFFRPATAGCIGAALAVARIDGAPMADTLGLAYSFCAGTMQAHVEGSVALPLQIAGAARAAVTAADLARAGLTGPHDALEGPFGYLKLFDRGELTTYTGAIGDRWRIGEISVKPYPSGRASHALLSGLASLGLRSRDVSAITLYAPPLVKRLVGRPMRPGMTPAYARLCAPFLAALMLEDGRIDPRRFTPETFADAGLLACAARVHVEDDGNPDPNALSPQRLRIEMRDGDRELAIPHTPGCPEAPLTPEQAAAKRDLARALAPQADPRLFDDPLAWFTNPLPFASSAVEKPVSTTLDTNGEERMPA